MVLTIKQPQISEYYKPEAVGDQFRRYNVVLDTLYGHSCFKDPIGDPGPTVVARGQKRVNLIGLHTDHENGDKNPSCVLPFAVEEGTIIAAKPNGLDRVRIYCMNDIPDQPNYVEIQLSDLERHTDEDGKWPALDRGMLHYLGIQKGMDIVTHGDGPIGDGLSSSASKLMAHAVAYNHLFNLGFTKERLARFGQMTENKYLPKGSGLMDELISILGEKDKAFLIKFYKNRVETVPVDLSVLRDNGYVIAIVNSGVSHSGIDHLYSAIPKDMQKAARIIGGTEDENFTLGDLSAKDLSEGMHKLEGIVKDRARYFLHENDAVPELAGAFNSKDFPKVCKLINDQAYRARNMLHNTRLPDAQDGEGALEILMDQTDITKLAEARAPFGGGFGGSIKVIVHKDKYMDFSEAMIQLCGKAGLDNVTVKSFTPVQGACVVATEKD